MLIKYRESIDERQKQAETQSNNLSFMIRNHLKVYDDDKNGLLATKEDLTRVYNKIEQFVSIEHIHALRNEIAPMVADCRSFLTGFTEDN
jgi:hypothetical protein